MGASTMTGPYAPPPPPAAAAYGYGNGHVGYPTPYPVEPPEPPAHNTVEMTREMLLQVLDRFAEVLARKEFFGSLVSSSSSSSSITGASLGGAKENHGPKIRLITHGGACMLLHPQLHALSMNMPLIVDPLAPARLPPPKPTIGPTHSVTGLNANANTNVNMNKVDLVPVPKNLHMSNLPRRTTTRDVDVLLRAFVVDYGGHKHVLPGYTGYSNPNSNLSGFGSGTKTGDPGEAAKEAVARVNANVAAVKLRDAIRKTAQWFFNAGATSGSAWGMGMGVPLGADWMNADADVALPLGVE